MFYVYVFALLVVLEANRNAYFFRIELFSR